MVTNLYVNLPVKDLERTKAFFAALGFTFHPQFTNEKAAGMIIAEHIYAMLLTEPFYQTFTTKTICDAAQSSEVMLALQVESRGEVDAMVAKAVAAGGSIPRPPQDQGFMYGHAFQDLDGHVWEVFYMEPSAT